MIAYMTDIYVYCNIKKEENKRIVEEMYKSQIKKIKEALFFFMGIR